MKRKISVVSALLVIVILCMTILASVGCQPKAAEVKVIEGLVQGNVNDFFNVSTIVPFIEAVNKRLDGQVQMVLKGGPEVIPMNQQADAVRSGAIDMVFYGTSRSLSTVPGSEASDLTELTGVEERESGAFDLLSESYEKYLNAKYLGEPHSGPGTQFHIYLRDPISKIDELKGMQMRSYGVFDSIVKGLGASSVNMPLPDLYTAMQRKVVDGYISLNHSLIMMSLADVANYVVDPGFMQLTSSMYMNMDVWKSLSKKEQDVILEEVLNTERKGVELSKAGDTDDLEKAKAINTKVITLDSTESAKLLDIVTKAAWDHVLATDTEGYAAKLRPMITK